MSALPQERWTEERYLAFERQSELKHEFYQGELFAMAGASPNHNRIQASTLSSLDTQLLERSCEVFGSDMRLKVSQTKLFTYPDVSIVCGVAQFDEKDNLLNPTVLIEVLSPSTEMYDRGKKFEHYRTLASLQEYLLISQDKVLVEQYIRDGEQWLYRVANSLEASLEMPSIDCRLELGRIYRKVEFPPLPENEE